MTRTFGPDYVEMRDGERILNQMGRIMEYIADEHWFTLRDIERDLGYGQASISAQLRHLRKPKFGSHIIVKRHEHGGLWWYRLHVTHEYIHGVCRVTQCGRRKDQVDAVQLGLL